MTTAISSPFITLRIFILFDRFFPISLSLFHRVYFFVFFIFLSCSTHWLMGGWVERSQRKGESAEGANRMSPLLSIQEVEAAIR